MVNDITLQHSLVNSGSAITLKGASVTYKWVNKADANPAVAKFDIVSNNYQGFENPTISIKGIINTIDLDINDLTQQHLINFATLKTTTAIVLTIPTSSSGTSENPFPATPVYLGGRPSSTGYASDGTNTLSNSINVFIKSFSIDLDSGSEMGHIWNYSIELQETL